MSTQKKSTGIWLIKEFDQILIRLQKEKSLSFVYELDDFRFRTKLKIDPSNRDRLMILGNATIMRRQTLVPRILILDNNLDQKHSVNLVENDEEAGRFTGHFPVNITELTSSENCDILSQNTLKLAVEFVLFDNYSSKYQNFEKHYFEAITSLEIEEIEFESSFNMNNQTVVAFSTPIIINKFKLVPMLYPTYEDGKATAALLNLSEFKNVSIYGNIDILKSKGESYNLQIFKNNLISGDRLVKAFPLDKIKNSDGVLPKELSIKFRITIVGSPETIQDHKPTVCLTPEWIKKWNDHQLEQDADDVLILFSDGVELCGNSSQLAAFSNVFAESFKIITKKDGIYKIQLNDVDYKSFNALSEFFNSGKIPSDRIGEFLIAAFKFKYDHFDEVVDNFLQ